MRPPEVLRPAGRLLAASANRPPRYEVCPADFVLSCGDCPAMRLSMTSVIRWTPFRLLRAVLVGPTVIIVAGCGHEPAISATIWPHPVGSKSEARQSRMNCRRPRRNLRRRSLRRRTVVRRSGSERSSARRVSHLPTLAATVPTNTIPRPMARASPCLTTMATAGLTSTLRRLAICR